MQRPKDNDPDDEFLHDGRTALNDAGPSAAGRSRNSAKRRNASTGAPNTPSDYEGYETELIKLAALDPLDDDSTPVQGDDIDNHDSLSDFSSEYDYAAADLETFRFDDDATALDTVGFYDGLEFEMLGHDGSPNDEDEQFLLPYQRYLSSQPEATREFDDQANLYEAPLAAPQNAYLAAAEYADLELEGGYLEYELSGTDPFGAGALDEQSGLWFDVSDLKDGAGDEINVGFNANPDFSFAEQLAEAEPFDKIIEVIPEVAAEYAEWQQSPAERRFMGSGGIDRVEAEEGSQSSAWDHDKKVLERARILAILRRAALLADDTSNIRDDWFELEEFAAFDGRGETEDASNMAAPDPADIVWRDQPTTGNASATGSQASEVAQPQTLQATTIVIGRASRLDSNPAAIPHASVVYEASNEIAENPYFDELLEKNDAFSNTMKWDSKKLEKAARTSNWHPEDDNIIGASHLHSGRHNTYLDGIANEVDPKIIASAAEISANAKRGRLRQILRRAK